MAFPHTPGIGSLQAKQQRPSFVEPRAREGFVELLMIAWFQYEIDSSEHSPASMHRKCWAIEAPIAPQKVQSPQWVCCIDRHSHGN